MRLSVLQIAETVGRANHAYRVTSTAAPVFSNGVSYRARQFVISGVFYRYREHGVFVKTSDDPASFRCRSRLRWSSALHGSFVLIQIPFPRKPAMANIAGERFWSAATRVSLQGEAARESASACRTFMHRDRCCCGGGRWSSSGRRRCMPGGLL